MKKPITIFALMILLFGCSSKNAEINGVPVNSDQTMSMVSREEPPPSFESEKSLSKPLPPPPAPHEISKKIIHTAYSLQS